LSYWDIGYRVATMAPVRSSSPALPRSLLVLCVLGLGALTAYVLVLAGRKEPHASGHTTRPSSPQPSHVTSTAVPCVPSVLGVAATTDAKQYRLNQRPELEIRVTNTGQAPCMANLSDSQIELLVYNGWSRVWGSHDCTVQPGNSPVTLAPQQTARRTISWSGTSSQPHCAGSRERVGMGSYTLRARFAGMDGRTATFTIAQ
jgi:hypothetical protein